jgi:hypothetical protein
MNIFMFKHFQFKYFLCLNLFNLNNFKFNLLNQNNFFSSNLKFFKKNLVNCRRKVVETALTWVGSTRRAYGRSGQCSHVGAMTRSSPYCIPFSELYHGITMQPPKSCVHIHTTSRLSLFHSKIKVAWLLMHCISIILLAHTHVLHQCSGAATKGKEGQSPWLPWGREQVPRALFRIKRRRLISDRSYESTKHALT